MERKISNKLDSDVYPVTNNIYIRDDEKKLVLSIFNDRAQGAFAFDNGLIGFYLYRSF